MPAAAAEAHLQVLVVADFLQVGAEQLGEGDLVQVVVLPAWLSSLASTATAACSASPGNT